jgi:hypothetical protein
MKGQSETMQVCIFTVVSSICPHYLQETPVHAENKGLLAASEEQRSSLQVSVVQSRKDAVDQHILLDERLSKQELASERLLDAQQKRADTAENETKQARMSSSRHEGLNAVRHQPMAYTDPRMSMTHLILG